jgi:hypothetical protein
LQARLLVPLLPPLLVSLGQELPKKAPQGQKPRRPFPAAAPSLHRMTQRAPHFPKFCSLRRQICCLEQCAYLETCLQALEDQSTQK